MILKYYLIDRVDIKSSIIYYCQISQNIVKNTNHQPLYQSKLSIEDTFKSTISMRTFNYITLVTTNFKTE